MKGPGLRLDLDVRRIWRCTKCGKVARTPGQVTAQRCGCTEPAQWMHLEPAVKKEPFRAPVREHLPEAWELEEAAAANTTPAETAATNQSEPPAVESTPPATIQPDSGSTGVLVTEVITTEIVEFVAEVPAPDPTPPTADEFGTGVEDPPRNPEAT